MPASALLCAERRDDAGTECDPTCLAMPTQLRLQRPRADENRALAIAWRSPGRPAPQSRQQAITSRYLRGIDNAEIIAAVHERRAPMIPADPRTPPRR